MLSTLLSTILRNLPDGVSRQYLLRVCSAHRQVRPSVVTNLPSCQSPSGSRHLLPERGGARSPGKKHQRRRAASLLKRRSALLRFSVESCLPKLLRRPMYPTVRGEVVKHRTSERTAPPKRCLINLCLRTGTSPRRSWRQQPPIDVGSRRCSGSFPTTHNLPPYPFSVKLLPRTVHEPSCQAVCVK